MANKRYPLASFTNKLKSIAVKLTGYLLILLAVILAVSLVRNVRKIQTADREIKEVEGEVLELKLEQESLQDRLSEVRSEEFVEKQLRDKLGLVKDGEIVVILPEDEVVKKFAPKFEEEVEDLPDPNWKKWLKLFI